jgi:hypothetical protein
LGSFCQKLDLIGLPPQEQRIDRLKRRRSKFRIDFSKKIGRSPRHLVETTGKSRQTASRFHEIKRRTQEWNLLRKKKRKVLQYNILTYLPSELTSITGERHHDGEPRGTDDRLYFRPKLLMELGYLISLQRRPFGATRNGAGRVFEILNVQIELLAIHCKRSIMRRYRGWLVPAPTRKHHGHPKTGHYVPMAVSWGKLGLAHSAQKL